MPHPLSRGPRAVAEDHRNIVRAWFRVLADPKRADGKERTALLRHLREAITFLGPVPEERPGRRPLTQGQAAIREDVRSLTKALDRARLYYPKEEYAGLIEHLKKAIALLVGHEREEKPVREKS